MDQTSPDRPLDPLSRLAIRHGTDKWGQHLYTPHYHRLFAPLRETPIRLLEIGVGWPTVNMLGGASLRMWRDYFPYGRIVGLDVQPKRLDLGPRVTVLQGSQSDPGVLRQIWDQYGPFDIVVDDGSHRAGDVLLGFETLFPLLPEGGFYAVEDAQTAFWPEFDGNPAGSSTIMSRIAELMQAMHAPEVRAAGLEPVAHLLGDLVASVQVFRSLAVIERGRNDYPSNRALDLSHPAVQASLRRLDAEYARDPSDGAILVGVGMLEVAGRLTDALSAAQHGLAKHPNSLDLLCIALYLATRLNLEGERQLLLERLRAIAPTEEMFARVQTQGGRASG